MKKKIIITISTIIIALGAGASIWYFGFYKPKQDLQKSKHMDENIILSMALQQYNYAFGGDDVVYKKCQSMPKSGTKSGYFTTQDIERRSALCRCTTVEVKREVVKWMAGVYTNATIGKSFSESEFKTQATNLKKNSDTIIGIALDTCLMKI